MLSTAPAKVFSSATTAARAAVGVTDARRAPGLPGAPGVAALSAAAVGSVADDGTACGPPIPSALHRLCCRRASAKVASPLVRSRRRATSGPAPCTAVGLLGAIGAPAPLPATVASRAAPVAAARPTTAAGPAPAALWRSGSAASSLVPGAPGPPGDLALPGAVASWAKSSAVATATLVSSAQAHEKRPRDAADSAEAVALVAEAAAVRAIAETPLQPSRALWRAVCPAATLALPASPDGTGWPASAQSTI